MREKRRSIVKMSFEELGELIGLPEDADVVAVDVNLRRGSISVISAGDSDFNEVVTEMADPVEKYIEYEDATTTSTK